MRLLPDTHILLWFIVVIAGQTYAARMGENAFGVRVEGAKPRKRGTVILHRRDGTTKSISLDLRLGDD